MEGDHLESGDPAGLAPYISLEKLKFQLQQIDDRELPVLFTGGEPTLNPQLPQLIEMTRVLGFKRIGLQTNGRRLYYKPYLLSLIKAGLSEILISIHGSTSQVHEAMTRLPGFFQTLGGLHDSLRWKTRYQHLRISTTSTICHINLKDLTGLLRLLLRNSGIGTVVLNPLIVQGNASRYQGQLIVSYAHMLEAFRKAIDVLRGEGLGGFDRITWTDIPPCVMRGLEDYVGTFERVTVFPPETERMAVLPEKLIFPGVKRPQCLSCLRRHSCTGISPAYIRSFGWSEFIPCGVI
jgi:MoaA/NifB/PqqE/SkfB family radical SAM enzyme